MSQDDLISREFLDELLETVNMNTSPGSINFYALNREERGRIISKLLPAIRERIAKGQVLPAVESNENT